MVQSSLPEVYASDNSAGGVRIWKQPEEGEEYVIGIDSASGAPGSDFAAASVINAKTCDLVAVVHERCNPKPWGERMARLGWYYGAVCDRGESLLAFEVEPTAHGAAAQEACQTEGYKRLYVERKLDVNGRPLGNRVGWRTDQRTKDRMINRVRQALEEGYEIPFGLLIDQLREQKWDERRRDFLNRKVPADLFDSYSIALCARDYAWREGLLKEEIPKPSTYDERFWAQYNQRRERMYGRPKRRQRYAGPV